MLFAALLYANQDVNPSLVFLANPLMMTGLLESLGLRLSLAKWGQDYLRLFTAPKGLLGLHAACGQQSIP